MRIVYRGLGRAFVVHKNRDLEGNNFLAALGLVCILVTSSQQGVAVILKIPELIPLRSGSVTTRVSPHIHFEANIANLEVNIFKRNSKLKG